MKNLIIPHGGKGLQQKWTCCIKILYENIWSLGVIHYFKWKFMFYNSAICEQC